MTKVKCTLEDCAFNDDGVCSQSQIQLQEVDALWECTTYEPRKEEKP